MDTDTFSKSIARSFVIDLSDTSIQSWFDEAEWREIESAVIPLPERDPVLAESLRKYCGVCCPSNVLF